MELYILDENRIPMDILEYESLVWAKRYYEYGDCEVILGATPGHLEALRAGRYIMRDDDDMVCRMESIALTTSEDEENRLTVVAKDTRSILDQRVVWTQTNYTGTVEGYIRHLVNTNIISPSLTERAIPGFILGEEAGLTDTLTEQVTYTSLGEKVGELCKAYGYGTRVTVDTEGRFIFTVYAGMDRTYAQEVNDPVLFSPEFDNLLSSEYTVDYSNMGNVALVAGEGEGTARKRQVVGTAMGIDRYEIFVDAKDVSSTTEEGGTIDYDGALQARGIEALGSYGMKESFDGEVEPRYSYQYKKDYNLGDVVQVSNEYGVSAVARITEVLESFDQDGYSIIPTFTYKEE